MANDALRSQKSYPLGSIQEILARSMGIDFASVATKGGKISTNDWDEPKIFASSW